MNTNPLFVELRKCAPSILENTDIDSLDILYQRTVLRRSAYEIHADSSYLYFVDYTSVEKKEELDDDENIEDAAPAALTLEEKRRRRASRYSTPLRIKFDRLPPGVLLSLADEIECNAFHEITVDTDYIVHARGYTLSSEIIETVDNHIWKSWCRANKVPIEEAVGYIISRRLEHDGSSVAYARATSALLILDPKGGH